MERNQIQKEEWISENLCEKLAYLENEKGLNVAAIFLQGSQNYGCDLYTDDYESNIDAKAIVMPTLDDLVKGGKKLSEIYVMDDGSHVEVKDIRLIADLWAKQNPTYLEILFTEYRWVVNIEIFELLDMANEIAEMNKARLLRSIAGAINTKYKYMFKPTPSSQEKFDKYGYDTKSFSHLLRLFNMFREIFIFGKSFGSTLIPDDVDKIQILNAKQGLWSLEDAKRTADSIKGAIDNNVDGLLMKQDGLNEQTYKKINDIVFNTVRNSCVEEIWEA